MEVRGRDAIAGLPRMIELTSAEVTVAILPILHQIIGTVKAVLEETPPELAADIIDKGGAPSNFIVLWPVVIQL